MANSIGYRAQLMISNLPNVKRDRDGLKSEYEPTDIILHATVDTMLEKTEKEIDSVGAQGHPLDASQTYLEALRSGKAAPAPPAGETPGEAE